MTTLKGYVRDNRVFYRGLIAARAYRFERRVARDRARYNAIAAERGLTYSENIVRQLIEERLRQRGLWKGPRQPLHFFLAIRQVSWERFLVDAFRSYGEVTHFDWNAGGFDDDREDWLDGKRLAMNRRLLEAFDEAHKCRPVDLFLGYLSNRTASAETIERIGGLGTITANISLDDWHAFWGPKVDGMWQGNAPLVRAFDINWTNIPDACVYYLVEGGIPLFLPEGAEPSVHRPYDVPRDIEVSFVGQRYAYRPVLIDRLRRRDVTIQTFGLGWPSGPLGTDDMVKVYSRSVISLGFSGTHYSSKITCLKGRDFEVPLSGGLYLTQYNPELERCYKIGSELLCYRSEDDLIEQIRAGLRNRERLESIRAAGRARALAEHTWARRIEKLLTVVGLC